MKKTLLIFCISITASLFVKAQKSESKIGYISTDELIASMPEAVKADADLKEYQASLAQQREDMMKELNDKDSIFVRDSAKLSPSMKEIKKDELINLYQRVQNWNQQAQEMYQAEAQKKLAPIKTKAMEAIKAVAKENNYAYVMDITSLIVAPPGDDLLPKVKTKMGIKDENDTPAPKKKP